MTRPARPNGRSRGELRTEFAIRSDERRRMVEEINNYADYEAARTGWDGAPGLLGNWVGGIREGVKVIRGERP